MPRRLCAAALGSLLVALGVLTGAAPAPATPGPVNSPEYWFDSWHIPELWAAGARGEGVTIAEIDTGVNAALPELRGRILRGTDLGDPGDGQIDRELNPFGHGTAMASIMVARPGLLDITGLAPSAKILPIAVPLNGTSETQDGSALPAAIRYAANHGAKIISMSVGGKQYPKYDAVPCPTVEQAAIFYALRRGAVVVASVGNTGPTDNVVEQPAACLGVVSVGAVDETGTVASFSARQPYLSLVAPGVDVPSLGRVPGDAFSGDGTSQATALVSAALALAWSVAPAMSGRRIVSRLFATLDAHRSTPSAAYGYGLLNAYNLVTASVPAGAPNPVFSAAAPFEDRIVALGRSSPPRPAPAGRASAPTRAGGTFAVAHPPGRTDRRTYGLGLAATGLLALVGLAAFGARRRRTRAAAGAPARTDPRFLPDPAIRPRPSPGPGSAPGGQSLRGPVDGADHRPQ